MEQDLLHLQTEAASELSALDNPIDLEELRIKYLGRKGLFTGLLRNLGQVPSEERPRLGKLANRIKEELEAKFADRKAALASDTISV
ncbi:MAG: phenylalanine--tRNA ligase subunit alpha, partial [Proteobacteria bacterium]|nr:phenylalanine--tRNA ligase subunit alpha [Pseudomonadota bacterium]